MAKRKALGKGLSALIPEAEKISTDAEVFFQCPVEDIEPNPYQPRQDFHERELEELARSVREKGVLTPLLVSKTEKGYRLIAGERRWRAAIKAGLERVPVVVKETSAAEQLELALIENIHRRDLNPIEEAMAYKRLIEDTNMTQEALAKRLGRERSTITNMLRLLRLPQAIQKDVLEERLSMGHARALAGIEDSGQQERVRDLVIRKALSVRQTEELIKRIHRTSAPKTKKEREIDSYLRALEEDLKRSLGTKVEIRKRGKGGTLVIHFFSDDELGRLLEILT
ncbi:MAG: ParB/RepB/Spo0J family partition protein [Deltaproteobacteria bacterium]|nr:ParB/RepB/Spo0J family partition protein [Deltaproteobacteria bacterium]